MGKKNDFRYERERERRGCKKTKKKKRKEKIEITCLAEKVRFLTNEIINLHIVKKK